MDLVGSLRLRPARSIGAKPPGPREGRLRASYAPLRRTSCSRIQGDPTQQRWTGYFFSPKLPVICFVLSGSRTKKVPPISAAAGPKNCAVADPESGPRPTVVSVPVRSFVAAGYVSVPLRFSSWADSVTDPLVSCVPVVLKATVLLAKSACALANAVAVE